jgi:hypothetical protein
VFKRFKRRAGCGGGGGKLRDILRVRAQKISSAFLRQAAQSSYHDVCNLNTYCNYSKDADCLVWEEDKRLMPFLKCQFGLYVKVSPKISCRFLSLVKIKTCSQGSVPLNAAAVCATSRDQDSTGTSKETYQSLTPHVFIAVVFCTRIYFQRTSQSVVLKLLHVSVTNCSHLQGIISSSTHTACYTISRPQMINYVRVVSFNT